MDDPFTRPGPRINNPWGRVLLALGLQLILSGFLGTVMLAIGYVMRAFPEGVAAEALPQVTPPTEADLIALLRTPGMIFGYYLIPVVVGLGVVVFGRRVIDRRPLADLAFRPAALRTGSALRGFFYGGGFAAAVILFVTAAGGRHLRGDGFSTHGGPGGALPLLLVLVLAAVMEEWLVRGYVLTNLRALYPFPRAAFISALAFTLVHVDYPGSGFLSWFNLFLAGMVLAQLRQVTGSLAVPVAVHVGWNLVLGGVLGAEVGGFGFPSLFRVSLTDLPEILGGGPYGPQGSLAVTVLFAASALALARMLQPRDEDDSP